MKLLNKKKSDGTEMIGRSMGQETWRRLKKNKGAMMGIAFIILLLIGTALASIFYDYDKDIIGMTRDRFMAPNLQHPFGTDNMGRDIFARVIYGAKYSLFISFGSTLLGLIVGLALGAVAGYYGGLVDNIIMRLTDIFYSIPYIMIAVVVVSILGTSMSSLLFAMALGTFCNFARIGRASVMTVRDMEFVEAGRAIGLPTWKIILKHILPNCMSVIFISTALQVPSAIFTESYLSFIGLGVQAPMPSLGSLANAARGGLSSYPYKLVFPAVMICLIVLSCNLLGDGLRDAFDPKLRR